MAEDKSLEQEVRTRFAPSPTGFLHIGGVRTALFNYLFAKSKGGKFILRIEDTDKERSEKKYEENILESLKWLNIEWDEGIEAGGAYGPYRQSERIAIYAKYLKKLFDENKAYYCFCSEDELEAQRQHQMSLGQAPKYSGKCANLTKETAEKYLAEGKPSVIRFRMPSKKIEFHDLIRGNVEFDSALFGDIVIAKDLNSPLYNFSVIVDDYEMKISHVIRGEEHLSNTPRQILIHEALNLPVPKYAHIPLILAPDRTKLSKRHGSVSATEYEKDGYLPEAMVNFIVFLGWNPGGEREIYSMDSLIKDFSLEGVQKAGAIFNSQRLDFINGLYIRQLPIEELTNLCVPYLIEAGLLEPYFKTVQYPPAYGGIEIKQNYKIKETGREITILTIQNLISLYKERLKKISEISELTDFFFKKNLEYDKNLLRWRQMTDQEIENSLKTLENTLSRIKLNDWNKEIIEKTIMPISEETGDRGRMLWPLRAALTGKKASAGPFEVAALLGKEKSLELIKNALELLGPQAPTKN